jgi:hypothetical protein
LVAAEGGKIIKSHERKQFVLEPGLFPDFRNIGKTLDAKMAQPLPPGESGMKTLMCTGWEMAADQNGAVYFIDHNTKTTTFADPRLQYLAESSSSSSSSSKSHHHHQDARPQMPTKPVYKKNGKWSQDLDECCTKPFECYLSCCLQCVAFGRIHEKLVLNARFFS